ncbi:MAG: TonB-dependent receptor [Bacteroidetes bacterium]|nr:TonB-dependent receptor [Bacteroidota bacterium]
MKIFLSFLFLFVISTSHVYSQTSDSLNYCVVVVNDSGVYVPNMNLRIVSFKKTDGFLKQSTTDFSGTACITLAHGRDYNLIIDDSAYTRIKKKISPDVSASIINDTIFLSTKITSTDVINVEAQKDFMHIEDDKMVYDISKMKIDPGPNGLELMKKIPMVSVDGENVLLRGNSVKILFDGREQNIYGDLRSIPTDMIEKVEVMTVVPAKYEAEGIDGVINVVLKKIEEAKYKVSIGGWGNSNNYANLNQSVNFKKDKSSFFLNTSERLFNPKNYSYSTRKNISTGEMLLISNDTNTNTTNAYRINPGIIYDINKNLYFGLEGVLNVSKNTSDSKSYRQYSYQPDFIQQLFRNNNNDNKDYSFVGYINQKEITGKDEVNLEFNLSNTKYNSDFDQVQVIGNVSTPFTSGTSDIKNNNYNIKLDYSKKISDDVKFETGFKDSYKRENNNYFNLDTSGSFSSDYEFTESIYSYYGTLTYNTNSIHFKPGLRIEYSDMRGLVNTGSQFTNYQFDIFPSMLVTKYFSDNTQIQLSYGKRIERPRFNVLNPFPIKRDIYNLTTGNPELQPAYTHSFEFKFTKPLGKNNINTNFFFKHNTNLIQNLRYIDSIYTRSQYRNNGYSNEYGTDGSLSLTIGEFWNTNLYGRIGKKIYGDDSLNASTDGISYNLSVWGGYSNPEVIDASLSLYYAKYNFSALTDVKPFSSLSFSLGKNFFDRKLSLYLSLDDIFNSSSFENTYIRSGFEEFSRSTGSMGRSVSLNVRFTFGNYDEKRQKGKDIKGEDYGD